MWGFSLRLLGFLGEESNQPPPSSEWGRGLQDSPTQWAGRLQQAEQWNGGLCTASVFYPQSYLIFFSLESVEPTSLPPLGGRVTPLHRRGHLTCQSHCLLERFSTNLQPRDSSQLHGIRVLQCPRLARSCGENVLLSRCVFFAGTCYSDFPLGNTSIQWHLLKICWCSLSVDIFSASLCTCEFITFFPKKHL